MDKYTEKSREAYNKKAKDYENTRDYKSTKKLKDSFIKYLLKQNLKGKNVLDIACGTGDLLNELYKKNSIIGTGIDIAENMIQEANNSYGKHMKFLNTNAENILIEDNTGDAVIICCAFHHMSNPEKVLSEINRVLHNGGHLYIADFLLASRFLNGLLNNIYHMIITGDVKLYSKEELETFCANTGFVVEEHNRVDKLSYIAKLKCYK